MRRQGNIWTGTLPFILGLALLLGCFVCSAEVRAQGAKMDVLQGAGTQSGATSLATGTDDAGVMEPPPKKPARPIVRATRRADRTMLSAITVTVTVAPLTISTVGRSAAAPWERWMTSRPT